MTIAMSEHNVMSVYTEESTFCHSIQSPSASQCASGYMYTYVLSFAAYRAGAQDVYSCEKGQKVWPRGLIWVAVSIPKMFCWQAWGGAFTPKSPFEVPKKLHLFMLKGPRKKTLPSCSLGFQEYEMDNASNFTRGFTPASNPKRGNEMGFYLC